MHDSHESTEPALTPVERRILELLTTGLSNSEVADQIGMPVADVRGHVRSILARLGALSKLEALIIAIRRGLIELPRP